MKRNDVSFRTNAKLARQLWGEPSRIALRSLRELTAKYSLSIAAGDLQFLDGRWYVTHSGLLRLASRRGCCGINTTLEEKFSDCATGRWVFKAIVYRSSRSRGFDGFGDAICHLSAAAKQDRNALVCKLNSYAQPAEARS
jgi:hypothetical protein